MTLEEYLEDQCVMLQKALADVPAGQDLPPLFGFVKDRMIGIVPAYFRGGDKAVKIELFRAFLNAIGAEQYAIIAAAWYVALAKNEHAAAFAVIDREGTGGAYKSRRRECYHVVAGDREKTLSAMFHVERDYKGKIRRLVRQEGSPEGMFGRMTDLLVNRTKH
jgi:hypothetical protein